MRVDLQIKLKHLADRARLNLVGFLRIEVEQEPSQAVAATALGCDVVVHPRAGVTHRRERATALDPIVVVEANHVGAAPALADVRPFLPPGPSHPPLADARPPRHALHTCVLLRLLIISLGLRRALRASAVSPRRRHSTNLSPR